MKLSNRLTQRERILNLLRERGDSGVRVWELIAPRPTGQGIAQYNARIKELRDRGFNIINVKPGHFVLKEFKEVEIEKKGQTLHQMAFV